MEKLLGYCEAAIFNTRYLLIVGYLALVAGLGCDLYYIVLTVYRMISSVVRGDGEGFTINFLEAVDLSMLANAVFLIIGGSYIVYVRDKLSDVVFKRHEDRPSALRHLSPGSLKEKLAAALVGVTSVHLVQVLIQTNAQTKGSHWYALSVLVIIHLALITGMVAFGWVNHKEVQEEALEHETGEKS